MQLIQQQKSWNQSSFSLTSWREKSISDQIRLDPKLRGKLIEFLRDNTDCFSWSYANMTDIPLKVMTHKLNIDPH